MAERVLVVGNRGGREAALKWKIGQSPLVGNILDDLYTSSQNSLNFALQEKATFVVIGPEAPLAEGLVDKLVDVGIPTFGPTKEASRLEWDKAYADEFMTRNNIPHPKSLSFSNLEEALKYVQDQEPESIVIKASGLASGKGVILPQTKEEAELAIAEIFQGKYGDQDTVVVQERLTGREVSLICLTDGTNVVPLLPAQDYKRLRDNDEGPNTGGMGAFAPAPLEESDQKQIMETTVGPTIDGLRKDGITYKGALYFGLMLTGDGPRVLEYNCRFGDPETQAQMLLLSSDLFPALKACVDGNLHPNLINFKEGAAVCVVLASEGYPEKPVTGREVQGLDAVSDPNVVVFQAATETRDGKPFTAGGRVLGVTGSGQTREEARRKAYSQIGDQRIHFEGMQFRTDIGAS